MPKRKKHEVKHRPTVGAADALTQTLNYLLHVRGEQPTSPAEAGRHLGISAAAAGQRFARLVAMGQAEKLKRGLVRARRFAVSPTLDGGQDELGEMLQSLKLDRDRIDIRIQEVERVRDLRQEWIRSKQGT